MADREVAQAGSAPGLGPGGRRFESCLPDNESKAKTRREPVKAEFTGFFLKFHTILLRKNSNGA
jgi:hypothetical protein